MSENISFEERVKRLTALTKGANCLSAPSLVSVLGISDAMRLRVRTALNMYLWVCLSQAFPDKLFPLTDDMLRDYEDDILRLPNITPNGLILPKRENMLAFNILQRESNAAFAALGMNDRIARIQFPVNIRLQSGKENAEAAKRPRASTKPHSDIWAGDPASGILVFLSVLGDPANSGITFFQPRTFPLSYVRTLEDYNEGAPLMKDAEAIASFDTSGWFLADPYLIHQTTKSGKGTRISIDFRFIPKERVASDSDEDATRKPFFISSEQWMKLGKEKLITTREGMMEFSATHKKDPYTVGYPVKFYLTDVETIHEDADKKRAS